ncbi:acyl-CoA dehydrogenase family protein [Amycolatopsis pigmentata]|uniref:Acyl-CoA dehydrogenase family protein n=1 Tax=Amycolatopsis pigmentata TaxID=450801 RepID=A0ABW5FZX0_9PSEU
MATRVFISDPDRPSFLEQLYQGRFRWDILTGFPEQDERDRAIGDEVVAELLELIDAKIDGDAVDREAALPDGFLPELAARGFYRLQADPDVGGRALSQYNTYRVVQAAASRCTPVALSIALENALGAAPYLSVLPEGPLRDVVRAHVAAGRFSCSAETEPQGAANWRRQTVAERIPGSSDFLLTGEKVFVGHAPIADLIIVSATVRDGGEEQIRRFFVDADSPGVTAGAWHTYMGIRGFPNGWLRFDRVRVPAERMFGEARIAHRVRQTPASALLNMRGRLYLIGAPSQAVADLCCDWSRDFVRRRKIDGRGLGEYEEIRRRVAESLADRYAIDTVARWCLLPGDQDLPVNPRFEQNLAKNITSLLAWQVADRTMSVLAAEGYETHDSKAARGLPAEPVERYLRDQRNLRISGGVDFFIDLGVALQSTLAFWYPPPEPGHAGEPPAEPALTVRNNGHLRWVAAEVGRFGRILGALTARYTREELSERERTVLLIGGFARELLTCSLVLARAAALARAGEDSGQLPADVYCTSARHRVADLVRQVEDDSPADFDGLATPWLDPEGTRA